MKNKFFILCTLFVAISSFSSVNYNKSKPFERNLRVILIRHAEKSADGANLTCAGLNRALKLPSVLKIKYGVPDYVYVPTLRASEATEDCRMMQTVTPIAIKYNLPVNSSFGVGDEQRLVDKIRGNSGTVLVVWEHKRLVDIAGMLGVKSGDLNWARYEFDKIWVVTFAKGEAVLTEDKEGIHPVNNCPF